MINRLPADVPKSGEIYDITLTGAGLDRRKREIVMFVVDNGEFKGTRLSALLSVDLKEAFIRDADVPVEQISTRGLNELKLQLRLSAHVEVERMGKNPEGNFFRVDEDYKESNVYVAYHLTNFAYPNEDSEMEAAFARKDGKFERKNDPKPPAEKPVEEDTPDEKPAKTAKAATPATRKRKKATTKNKK